MQGMTPGYRWQTKERQGLSHREAGRRGGRERRWSAPRSPQTRFEAAMRYWGGEGTQTALAVEYGVSRSTMRRWVSAFEAGEEPLRPG